MRRWLFPLTATFGVVLAVGACSTQPAPMATSAPAATAVRAASPTAFATKATGTLTFSPSAGDRKEILLLRASREPVAKMVAELEKGDMAAARAAWVTYDPIWNGMEVYVNFRSRATYQDLELNWQAKIDAAFVVPAAKAADVLPMAKSMLAKWDETVTMTAGSPPISPLFDDVADIRIARQPLRAIPAALTANDLPKAKALFGEFGVNWARVSGLFKLRSPAAYDETEAAAKAVGDAFAKPSPAAADLTPLVAELTNRYSYGQNLVTAAARKADLFVTTYAAAEVQSAGGIRGIQNELKASLAAWETGNYAAAKAHADKVNTLLNSAAVSGPLKAKALDVALKAPLDVYAALAGASGDAAKGRAANKNAIEAGDIAIQGLVGQFWADPKLAPAITAATSKT